MAGTSSGRGVDVKSGSSGSPPTTSKSSSQPKPRKKLSSGDKAAMAALATLIEDRPKRCPGAPQDAPKSILNPYLC